MKYVHKYTLLMISAFFTSCGQNKTDLKKANIQSETKDLTTVAGANEKYVYTKYVYSDTNGLSLIIQNGGPKGGMKYTDPDGKVYSYAVFWTRIINETDKPLELQIAFPVDSYAIPSLPGKYFKILIPPDAMTVDKEPLYLFGLTDLKTFFDKSIHKSSSLKRTISPKKSNGFYVVMLSLVEGAHGTMRTELSLKGQNLYYKIKIDGSKSNTKSDDKEIQCGSINLKNFVIQ